MKHLNIENSQKGLGFFSHCIQKDFSFDIENIGVKILFPYFGNCCMHFLPENNALISSISTAS